MKGIRPEYLFADKPYDPAATPADYGALDIVSDGFHIYGEIVWPDSGFTDRPCVILSHGYPGTARNDDLAHALCRIGCVVLIPHYRGAWGSQGKYLVTNCIRDLVHIIEYVQTDRFCEEYRINKALIFLIGHSMGGCVTANAVKYTEGIRGIVLMAPFDPEKELELCGADAFWNLMQDGYCLSSDGIESIGRDLIFHSKELSLEAAIPWLKRVDVQLIQGSFDRLTPHEIMGKRFFQQLVRQKSEHIRNLQIYPADHGLLGCRCALMRDVAEFMEDSIEEQ